MGFEWKDEYNTFDYSYSHIRTPKMLKTIELKLLQKVTIIFLIQDLQKCSVALIFDRLVLLSILTTHVFFVYLVYSARTIVSCIHLSKHLASF